MKTIFFTAALLILALLAACDNGPIRPSYRPLLPEIPEHWKEFLGEPHWRLEWIGEGGLWFERDISPGESPPGISPLSEWSTPLLAWPFWPERELLPGMMRPAGAIFPWDACGQRLNLSWQGGVQALFWKELTLAERPSAPASAAEARRLPWYFDWPRFAELLESENISPAVREDPWLADWKSIAGRTIQSGFDRRRIVPKGFSELAIPGPGGRWIGSSPFAPPLDAPDSGPLVLKVSETADTWVSSGGVLKASNAGWVWRPH
ncbi:MAG: hypothetical protein FWB99_01155 [Treponema sp.]|nr:hypothetical protein [Treponema sp.]